MANIVYKNIYKVIILIGGPDNEGNIVITNISGNPKGDLPEIGLDLGVVIAEFLDLGYTIENILSLDGEKSLSQYTLVRTYCLKYTN